MNDLRQITIYTDGACKLTKIGGWGCILIDPLLNYEKEFSGCEINTTNNRMEILSVIKGLQALFEPCEVTVFSDSQYVVNAIERSWIKKWISNGWLTYEKKPVVNQDLWEILYSLCGIHKVNMKWVKGHAGNSGNERADFLATSAITNYREDLNNYVSSGVYETNKLYKEPRRRNKNKKR